MGLDATTPSEPKRLLQVVTIEGLTPKQTDSITLNPRDAFCESYRGSSGALDGLCRKLTKNNCNATSCCLWTSDDKCVAGGVGGPTFTSANK